ncbi:hypothetical protein niasHT_026234 [Heterodera trifolii]|uniref:PNPLA domain-containing protein n=1 Tax=Heterodera trifolii TaxID=157864 RepID=A0ABD2JC27_9BILA
MMLVANGADPKATDSASMSPLAHVLENETGKFQVAKLLLCFRAMLNVPAGKSDKMGTKSEESAVKKPECVAVDEAIWKEWQQMALNERRNEQRKNPRRKGMGVRALSLDGGGIRGVVLVQMLIEIESMMYGEGLPSGDRQSQKVWCKSTSIGLSGRAPERAQFGENNKMAELSLGNYPHHKLECFVSLGTGKAPTVPVGSTSLEIGTALIGAIRNLAGILMDQNVPFFRLTPELKTNVALHTIADGTLVDTLLEARDVHVKEMLR